MPIPRTDNELMVWLRNFSASFATHAASLGFTEADVNSVRADAAMLNYLIGDLVPTYKSALQARTAYKSLIMSGPVGSPGGGLPPAPVVEAPPTAVPPGVVPRLRQLVQRIQLAPGYTEEVGIALGIDEPEGRGPSAPDAPPKPSLKARSAGPGSVQLDFSKETFDGVFVESLRDGDDGWQPLGLDHYSPFIDERPPKAAGKPETRQYRVRYMLRDQPTGDWSDIVTTTFVP